MDVSKSLLAGDNQLMLRHEQDALDVISSGLAACIFLPEDLHPDFFDLANGVAGQVFQKFTNYRFPIAILLPVEHGYGELVSSLIRDHRTHPWVRFFSSSQDAAKWLASLD